MARFGKEHPAKTLYCWRKRFMGETAKILSPEKRVLMPSLKAECSLDLGCPRGFCGRAEHPDHTVVVYANTSAAIKAQELGCDLEYCLRISRTPRHARRENFVGA